jgi:hypothetical protein
VKNRIEVGQVTDQPKKKKKKWPIIVGVIVVIIILIKIGSGGSNSSSSSTSSTAASSASSSSATSSASSAASSSQTADATPSTVAVNTNLTSGNYTVGTDFPAGTYNLSVVSGKGNVSSSNMYTGGVNAMMGVDDGSGLYQQQYSNIKLDDKVVLTVSGGVTINIVCNAASGETLKPRSQSITETVSLGNGNFTAGTDFTAGTYNIIVVSGKGNVSSSNIYDGGINAMMGIDDGTGLYEKEYKNIDLPTGTTLTIDGVKIQLVPST